VSFSKIRGKTEYKNFVRKPYVGRRFGHKAFWAIFGRERGGKGEKTTKPCRRGEEKVRERKKEPGTNGLYTHRSNGK